MIRCENSTTFVVDTIICRLAIAFLMMMRYDTATYCDLVAMTF